MNAQTKSIPLDNFKKYGLVAALFIVASIIIILHLQFHPLRVLGMKTSIFYMDEQRTLAAYFTSVTAFLVGYFFLQKDIYTNQAKPMIQSIIMGSFFILLSADEYFELHEYTHTLIKKMNIFQSTHLNDLIQFSWIYPFLLLIICIFLIFTWTILSEKNTAVRNVYLLGVFAFGLVLLCEVIGGKAFGTESYVYWVGVEEGLEMYGVLLFLLALTIDANTPPAHSKMLDK